MGALFGGKPKAVELAFLVVPPGSTLVLRSKVRLNADQCERVREHMEQFKSANPGCSFVLLSEPDWDTAVIGAPR